MRKNLLLILLISLLLAMALSAAKAEKITVDPNAPGAADKAPAEAVDKIDERLAQEITYEARRKTVIAICADLTELTGVTFKAGVNEKDWQVRDRKMNIFAKDCTLANLMNSIARVMKFKWEIGNKDTTPTYRLFMNRKTLLDAESQRLREEEKRDRIMTEKREKMIGYFGKLDQLSPQDLAKLKQDNPFMYVAATSGIAAPLGQFFKEMPVATEALASGQELSLGGANISLAAQQGLMQAAAAFAKLEFTMGGRRGSLPDDILNNAGQLSVQLNSHADMMNSSHMGNTMLGEISTRIGERNIDFPFFDPDSKLTQMIGKAIIQSQEEDRPMDEVMKDMQGEMMQAVFSEMKRDESGEPAPEHPEDEALKAKIKIKAKDNRLDEIEAALADASKLAVVSDSFGRTMSMPVSLGEKDITIREALDQIADGYRYNWDKRASVIEFRDKNWFKKRAAQIPEAWIQGWRDTLKNTGTLDINDLAQIAALTFEQFQTNISDDDDLMRSSITGLIMRSRDMLRAYGSLGDTQQAAIFSEDGLNLRSLTPEQWQQIEKLINQRNGLFLQNNESTLLLRGRRNQQNKCYEYKFTLSTSEELTPIEWSFTTPEYKEPPEKPKTEDKPKQPAAGK